MSNWACKKVDGLGGIVECPPLTTPLAPNYAIEIQCLNPVKTEHACLSTRIWSICHLERLTEDLYKSIWEQVPDVSGPGTTLMDKPFSHPYEVGQLSARFDRLGVRVIHVLVGYYVGFPWVSTRYSDTQYSDNTVWVGLTTVGTVLQASFHTLPLSTNCQQWKACTLWIA